MTFYCIFPLLPLRDAEEPIFLVKLPRKECFPHASALRLHEELLFAVKVLLHPFAFLGSALSR